MGMRRFIVLHPGRTVYDGFTYRLSVRPNNSRWYSDPGARPSGKSPGRLASPSSVQQGNLPPPRRLVREWTHGCSWHPCGLQHPTGWARPAYLAYRSYGTRHSPTFAPAPAQTPQRQRQSPMLTLPHHPRHAIWESATDHSPSPHPPATTGTTPRRRALNHSIGDRQIAYWAGSPRRHTLLGP